jgi:hypothetical protein
MIVDEMALRRVVGGRKVMARQLRALLDFADRPNVRLWVVPFERSADAGFHWPFYTIGFPRRKGARTGVSRYPILSVDVTTVKAGRIV